VEMAGPAPLREYHRPHSDASYSVTPFTCFPIVIDMCRLSAWLKLIHNSTFSYISVPPLGNLNSD
jgi:hypothetical protein